MSQKVDNSELIMWREQEISQYIIKEIKNKLDECKKELCDGALIISPVLEREYCRAYGEISGYEFVLKLIESEENE